MSDDALSSKTKIWYAYFQKKFPSTRLFGLHVYSVPWSSLRIAHCLQTKLKHRKISPLQFYIPGFQNHPSYPQQKAEFLKSYDGNLK